MAVIPPIVARLAVDGIDREEQPVLLELAVERVEHDPGLHAHAARRRVERDDVAQVAADVDDQPAVDGLPALRGAAAARGHGHAVLARDRDRRLDVGGRSRDDDAERHDLIDRRVGRVHPARRRGRSTPRRRSRRAGATRRAARARARARPIAAQRAARARRCERGRGAGAARYASAAETPSPCADAGKLEPHLHAAQRPGQHQVVERAEVTDAEHAALQLAEPGAERHVETLEDRRAERVGVEAVGDDDRGQRVRILARIEREELEAPARARRAASPRRAARAARRRSAASPRAASAALRAARTASSSPACTGSIRCGCSRASRPRPSTSAAAARRARRRALLREIALNASPGGSIKPFCEPPTVTSTPHSSWR